MSEFDDTPRRDDRDRPSGLLSTDPFDVTLDSLIGLPNGAHTQAVAIRSINNHKHVTDFTVQTVRWEEGTTVFITEVSARAGRPMRIVLPPKVVATILRQQDQVSAMVRRKHGQRLAEQLRAEGKLRAGFTPEMRRKAAATRREKAAKRAARKAARG